MPLSAAPQGHFVADANGDGRVTVGDVGGWVEHAFFFPGDWALWALSRYAPPLGRFLEIDASDYGSLQSGVISAFAWGLLLLSIGVSSSYLRELDRRTTRSLAMVHAEVLRRVRIAVLRFRERRQRAREPANVDVEFSTRADLAPLELVILRLHADLAPGYALSVSDVAKALVKRSYEVTDTLEGLQKRGLLKRALAEDEGESTYSLSAAGRASLLLKQLEPRA